MTSAAIAHSLDGAIAYSPDVLLAYSPDVLIGDADVSASANPSGGAGGSSGGGYVSPIGGGAASGGTAPALTDPITDKRAALVVANGALPVPVNAGNLFTALLTSDCIVALSGWPTNGRAERAALFLTQDSTGGHNVTWPASIKWDGGPPPLTLTPGAVDCVVLSSFDGGATVFGALVGLNYQ